MKRQQPRRWRALMALGAASSLLIAACADDDEDEDTEASEEGAEESTDFEGAEVTVFGPEVEHEQQSLQETFAEFEEETGITVTVRGDRDFATQLAVDVEGGSPPGIAMVPQPGIIEEFSDDIVPLSDDVASTVEENFDAGWTDLVTVDGEVKGIPAKADLKSLVYYSPSAFDEGGYEIPETFEDFNALVDQMISDGNTPFCFGIGSGDDTGWPATDWVEDWVLRMAGPEVYDQWWQHEIPFDDPQIVEAGEAVYDLWSQEGAVYGGLEPAAALPFAEAGLPLLEDECMMYRLSNFYASDYINAGAEVGPDGDVSAFYLPGSEENPNITLTGGIYATAFSDDPAVMETMGFIASTEFADARAANEIGGFLSPNANVDTSLYQTEIEQEFGEILAAADPARFDASDVMPAEVGTGTFWTAMVDIVSGEMTVEEAFADVESNWPSD